MVNIDQIGMHIVSIIGETTWKSKGTKHIQVFGVEDKQQTSIAISSLQMDILLHLLSNLANLTYL